MTSVQLPDAREAIYSRIVTNWGTRTELTFANEYFDPPTASAWVRWTVSHDFGEQATLGGVGTRKFDRGGNIILQVFEPVNAGLATTDSHVQYAISFMEGVTFSGVWVKSATPLEVGPEGDYYLTTVDFEFEYTETR